MQILVYSGFSKRINSTKQPTGGTSIDVALKTPCSVMTPTFRISGFDLSWDYISWGSRYYYVDDVTIETNDIALYHCKLDTLATFRSDILSSSQLVTRNANTYQPYLTDTKYPALNKATIARELISTWDSAINHTGTYVIGIVNGKAHGGVSYYSFGAGGTNFRSLMTVLFGGNWLDPDPDISVEIQKELINPFQYIASCMWFPLTFAGDWDSDVQFGYWSSGVGAGLISESNRTVVLESTATLPRHPQQATHGIGMNGSPFTRYMLDCWCFGQIPIDPLPFVANNAIGFRIEVDVFTGQAVLTVTNANGGRVAKAAGNFGAPIQLTQVVQPVLAPIMSAVGAAGSMIAGMVTGNVAGGTVGAISGVGDAIKNAMPQMQTTGATGSKIAFSWTPQITAQFYELPTLAPQKVGRPLMEERTLSTLSGYTVCENVDLNTNASPDEKAEIMSYMSNGFFIE